MNQLVTVSDCLLRSRMPKNKRSYSPIEGSSKKVRFGSEDPIDDATESVICQYGKHIH